jgi:hypothetical protein
MRKVSLIFLVTALTLTFAATVSADRGKPSFSPMVYADGEVWGTKAVHVLPAPRGHNIQSFDKLFVITNSNNPMGQLPVGEAAPRNFKYNGGRWYTHTVTWTLGGIVPVLKSYDDIMNHYNLGHLTITPGSPSGGPPDFFECPLLPVKMQ